MPAVGTLSRLLPLLVGLVMVVAACGGGAEGEPTAGGEPTGAAAATTAAPDEIEPAADAGVTEEHTGGAEAAGEPLTVYSGRDEELVGPLFDQISEDTGLQIEVRYGDTAELAATILEEGGNSPADVFFGQDAGALGALSQAGVLSPLPEDLLAEVDERFVAADGTWVGTSGRARVVAYNTEALGEADLPDSVLDLTGEPWAGRVGWAPTNGSFQAFVTAMRVELGDDATREWLEGMVANDTQVYENNTAIVEALGRGEVEVGLVNHYYLYRFLAEDPQFPVSNAFLGGDVGGLINVAGAGVLTTSDQPEEATELVAALLSEQAQRYFSDQTFEYPLATGVEADDQLPPIAELDPPDVDLSDLEDLQGTLDLLRETGALSS